MMRELSEAEVARLGQALVDRGWRLAVAESCTGGWVAQALTAVSGSSVWFERGFVTYSNESKQDLLGVQATTLACHGAVSPETVLEMVTGVLQRAPVQLALAITGIAGPLGGSDEKPVGTVWIAWACVSGPPRSERFTFGGRRNEIRLQAAAAAVAGLWPLLQ